MKNFKSRFSVLLPILENQSVSISSEEQLYQINQKIVGDCPKGSLNSINSLLNSNYVDDDNSSSSITMWSAHHLCVDRSEPTYISDSNLDSCNKWDDILNSSQDFAWRLLCNYLISSKMTDNRYDGWLSGKKLVVSKHNLYHNVSTLVFLQILALQL